MRLIFLITGLLFLLLPELNNLRIDTVEISPSEINQTATIRGMVTLPPTPAASIRQYRGTTYRNRGNESNSNAENSTSNRYARTIVSAHPLSFDINNLPVIDSVLIIQKNAEFNPKITPVTVGSTVHFINNDSFYHNVFSLTPGARFNIGRRPTGDVYSKEVPPTKWKVSGLGPIELFCDIHPQMNAVILSLDTPYFTRVNNNGSYELTGLPAGTYELRVFNKDFDLYSQKITVAEDELYTINLNMMN